MGHTRLGEVPKTRKWNAIVAFLADCDEVSEIDVARIAVDALEASAHGLEQAKRDTGLTYAFYLLTQIALASRTEDWRDALQRIGVNLPDSANIFDFQAAINDAIDDYLAANAQATDVSEMAQHAVTEALTVVAGRRTISLFGDDLGELEAAVRTFSTSKGFSELGQEFFARFLSRFLNFYLSRATAHQVGRGRLRDIHELASFNDALRFHCFQSARIVKEFCGQWYSKTEFESGIDVKNSRRFIAVAVRKLQAELQRQRETA